MLRFIFFFYISYSSSCIYASDSLFIKVHFVYGSKPKTAFKNIESKQFGGIHGGHVYMETDQKIISYGTNNGKWHVFSHRSKSAGKYRIDKDLNWHGDTGKLKITTVIIPVTQLQLNKFKETEQTYFTKTPYDYAFLGMRCAAGAYDMLSKAEVCKQKSRFNIISRNFYPKRLRIKLLKRAKKENWQVIKQVGRNTRKWERD